MRARVADRHAAVEELLERAELLLRSARSIEAPLLDANEDLRREARRLRPRLEELVERPYGKLPFISYRRGLEARLAGPWSQYLTLGLGVTRVVRMTSWETSRPAIPTVLAHELAHRYAFDESVTTLRGLEVSARLGEEGDALHARSARLELRRLHLGAAMASAMTARDPGPVDAFFRDHGAEGVYRRPSAHWQRLKKGGRPDWACLVYAALPLRALEAALRGGRERTEPIPFPRFPLDSAQAVAAALYTGADALTGRRRAAVPVASSLRLLAEAAS